MLPDFFSNGHYLAKSLVTVEPACVENSDHTDLPTAPLDLR
jgi:hypothetical protein